MDCVALKEYSKKENIKKNMEEHRRREALFFPYRNTPTVLEEGWDKEIYLRNMITYKKRRERPKRAEDERIILERTQKKRRYKKRTQKKRTQNTQRYKTRTQKKRTQKKRRYKKRTQKKRTQGREQLVVSRH